MKDQKRSKKQNSKKKDGETKRRAPRPQMLRLCARMEPGVLERIDELVPVITGMPEGGTRADALRGLVRHGLERFERLFAERERRQQEDAAAAPTPPGQESKRTSPKR